MKKHLFIFLWLLSSAGLLRSTAIDDAIATAQQLQAKISASSEFQSPTTSNIQNATGDAASMKAFADNLVSQLSGVNVGPVDQIRAVSADIDVRVSTLQGVSSVNVGAMIEACRGLGDQLSKLQSLLPDLIIALKAQKAAALVAIQTATRWTPPTPIPDPADAGHPQPTPTPFPTYAYPTAVPTAPMQPGTAPTIPPATNPGTLPGGPSLPPPPPPVATPRPADATPTPSPLLKAPMAILAVGHEDEEDDSKTGGKVYVANYNMANVAILDTYIKRITGFIPVGNQPVAMALGAHDIVVVANYASNTVSLIDSAHDSVVATISVGSQPVAVVADGDTAYVVNQGSNSVTVIDLKYLKVSRTLNVGAQPSRIALRKGRAYVSNTNDDSVSVIDTKIQSVIATVTE